MFTQKALFICLAVLIPLSSVSQEYYRWVDSDGVSHFSQNPPPDNIAAEQAALPQNALTTPANTAVQTDTQQPTNSGETLNSFGKDPQLCSQILQSLQTMNEHENIVMTDPDTGDGFYLSESERAAEKIRLENMRSYYCE